MSVAGRCTGACGGLGVSVEGRQCGHCGEEVGPERLAEYREVRRPSFGNLVQAWYCRYAGLWRRFSRLKLCHEMLLHR